MNCKSLKFSSLLGLSAVTITLGTACSPDKKQDEKPNIIFILADDMGYGDLSCYGNKHIQTPHIDALAENGTRFTQAYAGSAVSSPSRCSLLTGKNTGNTTIRDNFCKVGGIAGLKNGNPIRRMHILPTDTTIALVLRDAGYRTCLVNKWHLDGFNKEATPLQSGFDEFTGWLISTEHSNSPYYYPYWRFDNDSLINIPENENEKRIRHNTDISIHEAMCFVHRNQDNPFFLYLAFDVPHEPYIINNTEVYDEQTWDANTKRYAALITHMDQAIGKLMNQLDSLGLRENTLVIFASDNGAARQAPLEELKCNGALRGQKAILYEGGIRVPFIVNQPGKVPVQTLENIIYFADVLPTLAALADAKTPQDLNGINVLPLFYGKQVETDNRLLYWEFPGKQRAARKGDWKVVSVKKNSPLELYNLKDDISESVNLADQYPEIVAEFEKEILVNRTPSPYWPD